MEEKIYTATVSQVNKYIKQLMDNVPVLANIWVKGEISNFKKHYSGHCYLTLKDDGGVLKSVMFKGSASTLTFEPENGMMVMARGRISVYERDGSYQLYIEEMQLDGVGTLHIEYEKLKNKLLEEGLFDEKYKKPLPQFPSTVGVITATTGAAIRDIINVLTRRYPNANIRIYPSLVQGDGAAQNIAKGIEYFNENKFCDVLIVGRGGGSIEDLWAFNEEVTARAIFASQIPIVSAVGHETDFTIADFVADMRAPTPSAAAGLVVPSALELRERIQNYKARMIYSIGNMLKSNRLAVDRLDLKSPKAKLDDLRLELDDITKYLIKATNLVISKEKDTFTSLVGKLEAMSPLSVLKRGYSIARVDEVNVIKSVNDIKSDDKFELILRDGCVDCKVI